MELDENQENTFSIKNLFDFLEKVNSAMVVKIEVKDIASAFTLFESINNRGMPLTPIDLIKNSIIGKMNTDPEKTNQEWQKIVKNIESYDDQVRYLRHYYHAFQNSNEVKIMSFSKATKSNIMHIYSNHIKKNVNFIFNELIDKSRVYTLFVQPHSIECINFAKYKNKLIDLKRLGIAPAYSLLLYLFVAHKDEDFHDMLNFLENWFIRRHLTDYPATNKLDQLFLDLINKINNKEYSLSTIKEFMMEKDKYRNDVDFLTLIVKDDLYTINTGATRCLLTKLEKSLRTKETEVDFWAVTEAGKLVWSIEHILPQNPSDKSDWNDLFIEEEKKSNLHRLGNLTLTCYNSTLSNHSFKDKCVVKDKNQNDIGLKSKNVRLNDSLLSCENWTQKYINDRSESLAKKIMELLACNIEN